MLKCACQGFEKKSICHHALAVTQTEGTLPHVVSKWAPNLSKQVNFDVPKTVGKKPGPKRRRHLPVERSVMDYIKRTKTQDDQNVSSDDIFSLVSLNECKATTCCGCTGKFSKCCSDPPPPAPWDFVLRRKEFRSFHPRGLDVLKISARKEFVYYHVKKSCVLKKVECITASDIKVDVDVIHNLGRLHKEQLK